MTAELTVSHIFRRHLLVIALLGAADAAVKIGDAAGHHTLFGLSWLFRLSDEGNVPTLFSALAIAAAALVALRLRRTPGLGPAEPAGWRVLAWLLACMALDEMLRLHEWLNYLGQRLFPWGPHLSLGVLPYGLAALAFGAALLRFWSGQSPRVRWMLAAAAATYVMAAFGLEIVEWRLVDAGAQLHDPAIALSILLEELGELFAIALLLRAFLTRFAELGGGPLLSLADERPILALAIRQ